MVYCTSDLCESGKFGIPVSCKCCREVHRCLREAGHAIVATDCHLVWHAKLSPFLPLVYSSSCTMIHLCLDYHYFSSMSILTRRERRVKGKFTFHSFLIFSKHQIFKACFFFFSFPFLIILINAKKIR